MHEVANKISTENKTLLIPLSNGYRAIIDAADYTKISGLSWFAKKPCKDPDIVYAASSQRNDSSVRTIFMHRLLTNCPPNMQVDHKNGDRLDCRQSNLEVVTQQENMKRRWNKS